MGTTATSLHVLSAVVGVGVLVPGRNHRDRFFTAPPAEELAAEPHGNQRFDANYAMFSTRIDCGATLTRPLLSSKMYALRRSCPGA
jgi:hypothetical protein